MPAEAASHCWVMLRAARVAWMARPIGNGAAVALAVVMGGPAGGVVSVVHCTAGRRGFNGRRPVCVLHFFWRVALYGRPYLLE